jgi:hypothetical protein
MNIIFLKHRYIVVIVIDTSRVLSYDCNLVYNTALKGYRSITENSIGVIYHHNIFRTFVHTVADASVVISFDCNLVYSTALKGYRSITENSIGVIYDHNIFKNIVTLLRLYLMPL